MDPIFFRSMRVNDVLARLDVKSVDEVFNGFKIVKSDLVMMPKDDPTFVDFGTSFSFTPSKMKKRTFNQPSAIRMGFGDIVRLYNAQTPQNPLHRPTNNHFPMVKQINYVEPAFREKRLLRVPLLMDQPVVVFGDKANVLLYAPKAALNLRAVESNVLPFIDRSVFPFSIIIDVTQPLVQVHVQGDLARLLKIEGVPSQHGGFTVVGQFAVKKIVEYYGFAAGFATFIEDATHVQKAAHSHFCVTFAPDREAEAVMLCNSELGYVPAAYHQTMKTDRYYAPDLLFDGQNFIEFSQCMKFDEQPPQLKTDPKQLKVMSWNLQAEANTVFDDALVINNPFVLHLGYKLSRIMALIKLHEPDIMTVCEAQPAPLLTEELELLGYKLYTTSMCNEFSYAPCDSGHQFCVSAVIVKVDRFELLEKKDIYFGKLSVDQNLATEFGCQIDRIKQIVAQNTEKVEDTEAPKSVFEFLKPLDTYNSATILKLRDKITGKTTAVAAVYPNWQPKLEAVKYICLKMVEKVLVEMKADSIVMGGDLNLRPSSPVTLMLRGHRLTVEQCDEMVRPFIEEMGESKGRLVTFSELLSGELGFDTKFTSCYEAVYDKIVPRIMSVGGTEITICEPKSTTKTSTFEDCLDYIYVSGLTPLKVDDVVIENVMADFACPSDHRWIGALVE